METLEDLLSMPRRLELQEHFNNRFSTSRTNSLEAFAKPSAIICNSFLSLEIAEVFCHNEGSFGIRDVDAGKIICVTMPQKLQTERRYAKTFLKLLVNNHALGRFDTAGLRFRFESTPHANIGCCRR